MNSKMDAASAIELQTEFALELFKKSVENDSNGVMSPISISVALAMAGAGAKGATLEELTSVLKLPEGEAMHEFTSHIKGAALKDGSGAGGPLVSFANGLWVANSMNLRPKFVEIVKGNYGAEVRTADFSHKAEEERSAINSWVLNETKGKIEDLLSDESVTNQTRLILANALYFKGAWKKAFDPETTVDLDFHILNGQTVRVPFLSSKKKQYIGTFDTYKILKLPYASGKDHHRSFSMYFVLPHDKVGLQEVEKNLDVKTLNQHCNCLTIESAATVLLPKFKMSEGLQLKKLLASLGLTTPFGTGADFSNMVEGPDANLLYISEVVHKAFVEVNEEGTEAAAATAVVVSTKSARVILYFEEFVADHPFLFILKEDITGVILFIGRITNPSL